MNDEFIRRLRETFDQASMAVVARRLGIPHATVRNYYQGRLPAPDVLMKIAAETGVSLNWLLLGQGEMYADTTTLGLGKFIERKVAELIDRRLSERLSGEIIDLGSVDDFDIEGALREFDDPQVVLGRWLAHEGRAYPGDYGIEFFRGWEIFSFEQKVAAVLDAKQTLDDVLKTKE